MASVERKLRSGKPESGNLESSLKRDSQGDLTRGPKRGFSADLDPDFACGVVSAWEERIWLDRRERAAAVVAKDAGYVATLFAWLRRVKTRMQMGPVATAWGGDLERPF
jgi:hypothetical protein